jgi:hypothetical protein
MAPLALREMIERVLESLLPFAARAGTKQRVDHRREYFDVVRIELHPDRELLDSPLQNTLAYYVLEILHANITASMTNTNSETIVRKQIAVAPRTTPGQLELIEDTNPRQRWLKMATEDFDRAGDRLLLSGLDTTDFLRNPQFLWMHGRSGESINTIGRILRLQVRNGALYALAEYADEEDCPLAEQIYKMDAAGMLPANSIGFRPIEFEENDFGGFDFLKWELIECSKVELPMNPHAIDDGTPKSLTLEEVDRWLTL